MQRYRHDQYSDHRDRDESAALRKRLFMSSITLRARSRRCPAEHASRRAGSILRIEICGQLGILPQRLNSARRHTPTWRHGLLRSAAPVQTRQCPTAHSPAPSGRSQGRPPDRSADWWPSPRPPKNASCLGMSVPRRLPELFTPPYDVSSCSASTLTMDLASLVRAESVACSSSKVAWRSLAASGIPSSSAHVRRVP
jgi:hypothetical protein